MSVTLSEQAVKNVQNCNNCISSVYFFIGKVIPNDRVHPRLWKGCNRKFRFIPRRKNEIKKQNKVSAAIQTSRTVIVFLSRD